MAIPSKNDHIVVSRETNEYLDRIEIERQRKIDEEQRRWYEMKHRQLGDFIRQEYPSTPKEAFESANEGLYYGTQFAKLRASGAVCDVPYDDSLPVHTAWDIGLDDFTSIFCFQVGRGGQVSIINYYENWDEGASHYCDWLNKQRYRFGRHILPHDARKRDIGAKTQYLDYVTPLLEGKFVVLDIKECDKLEGIQTVRSMLARCIFDEQKTSIGLKHLEAYKKVWDDRLGCYKNSPLHDEHSHACFIGETRIEIDIGEKCIKDVKKGDLVRTPNGYRKVLNTYKKYTDSLREIHYSDRSVVCTPQHQFFTASGLICADTLWYNCLPYTRDDLQLCQEKYGLKSYKQNIGFRKNFLSQKMNYVSIMTDTNIGGTAVITGHPLQKQGLSLHYIERFGRSISAIYQKVFTFIILMGILKTMKLETCNVSMEGSILHYTSTGKTENRNHGKASKLPCSTQNNGTEARRVRRGTSSMLRIWDSVKTHFLWFAKSVVRDLLGKCIIKNSVLTPVKQDFVINPASITKRGIVRGVTILSWLINTLLRRPVLTNVPLSLQEPQEVYDLEIEDDHCYYANGFLVSNSDAFRYLAVGLKGLERKDNSSVENDLKAVNRYYGI